MNIKPGKYIWRNKERDANVVVTHYLGKGSDGRDYVGIKGTTTGIPLDELTKQTSDDIYRRGKSMNISPLGQNFRDMLTAWDKFAKVFREEDDQREKEGRVKMLLGGNNFIFYFRFKEGVYGGSEEARLTFAAMRKGEDEGIEEMNFGATNLLRALQGQPVEEFFQINDLPHIHVMNKSVAEQLLLQAMGINSSHSASHHKHHMVRDAE